MYLFITAFGCWHISLNITCMYLKWYKLVLVVSSNTRYIRVCCRGDKGRWSTMNSQTWSHDLLLIYIYLTAVKLFRSYSYFNMQVHFRVEFCEVVYKFDWNLLNVLKLMMIVNIYLFSCSRNSCPSRGGIAYSSCSCRRFQPGVQHPREAHGDERPRGICWSRRCRHA